MKKLIVFLTLLFVFTGMSFAGDIIKTDRITEPTLLEQMLDDMHQTTFFTVSSEVSGTLSAETGHITFRMPYKFKLLGLRATVGTAPTADMIIDVNEGGTTVLSTKLYIQSGSTTSKDVYLTTSPTGSTYVISDNALADDAAITVDIDSTTGGQQLKITFYGEKLAIPTNY